MLNNTLFIWSKIELRILNLLVDRNYTLTELSEELEISKPALLKHLNSMIENDILKKDIQKTEIGREAVYTLNRFTLFISIDPGIEGHGRILQIKTNSKFELSNLLLEQVQDPEFKEDLKKLLKEIKKLSKSDQPDYMLLFGSVAEDKGTWKSDLDTVFLTDAWNPQRKEKVMEKITLTNMKTTHKIAKPQFLDFSEFEKGKSHLINEIKKNGIVIHGSTFGRPALWNQLSKYKNIMT